MTIRPLVALLAAALALAPGLAGAQIRPLAKRPATASGIRASTVSFEDTATLRLTFFALRAGHDLRLARKGADTVRVRFRITDSGEGHPLTRLLAAPAEQVLHASYTPLQLRTAAAHANVAPGAYTGSVQVLDRADKFLSQRSVRVDVPALLRPVEKDWTVTIYKFSPLAARRSGRSQQAETRCAPRPRQWEGRPADVGLAPCVRDNVFPLQLAWSERRLAPRAYHYATSAALLGVVKNAGAKDHAMVWWTGSPLGHQAGLTWAGVEMEFVGIDEPGEYTGTIRLPPEAGGEAVALSVKVTHHWTLVLIPIMLGVLLSMWLRSYVRRRQAVLALRERSAWLVARVERADAVLDGVDQAVGEAFRFQVDHAIRDRLREADRRIRALARARGAADRAEAERAALDTELTALEKTVTGWEDMGEALKRTATLLLEMDRVAAAFPGRADEPAVRAAAVAALGTALPRTEDPVHARCEEATTASELLQRWTGLCREAARLRDRDLAGLDAAVAALWTAADTAPLESVDRTLRTLKAEAGQAGTFGRIWNSLPSLPGSAPADDRGAAVPAKRAGRFVDEAADGVQDDGTGSPAGLPRWLQGLRQWVPAEPATPAQRTAVMARRKRLAAEFGAGTLAFLVASVTALSELYTSKVYFGTLNDYVVAALWGFGTKLGLDAVRSAVEDGVTWPFRRPPAPAPAADGK